MTWTTLPTFRFCSLAFVAIFDPWLSAIGYRLSGLPFQSFRSPHDLRELLRDLGLPSAIERPLQDGQHVAAGIGGILHRRAPRPVLGRRGLDQRAVELILHI